MHHDSAGHIAELLAKAINKNALDDELSTQDKGRVLGFLRGFGDLDHNLAYRGSSRAGYSTPPGPGQTAGVVREPLDFSALLDSTFWHWHLHFEKTFEQQATMLQPVGGMDRIGTAFEQQVGHLIRFGAEVREIRQTENTVQIGYVERVSQQTRPSKRRLLHLHHSATSPFPGGYQLQPKIRNCHRTQHLRSDL